MEANTIGADLSLTADGSALPDAAALMDQNMEDLFGEAADSLAVDALGVAMSAAPLTPAVVLRMLEKQNLGCCTKLAWANTGSIAQIVEGGCKIEFRAMFRSPKTGKWSLSEPSETPMVAPEGRLFQHIQFSGIGMDLAATDDRGVVHLHTVIGPLGKMFRAPSNITAADTGHSELDVVVGLHWLPTWPNEFKAPYITPAAKLGDQWTTELRNRLTTEPMLHHPADARHAIFYITRNGKLVLMYQNEATWNMASIELDKANSTQDLLSHTAMSEHGDSLLIVTHSCGQRFRLYKVVVDWHTTQHTRPAGPPLTIVAPSMVVSRVTMLEHISALHASMAVLSDLRFVPQTPPTIRTDFDGMEAPTLPTVFAVFTRAALPADMSQQQEAFSIIARWQVESVQPALHESFAKLKPNSNTSSLSPNMILTRLPDVISGKALLSLESQYYHTVIACTTTDGTVEFRDRLTLATLESYGDTTTVSSLPQAGFEHIMGQHLPHVAMSTDGSSLVVSDGDKTIEHKTMTLRYGWQPLEDGISDTEGLIEAAVVCLARQYSILSCSSTENDETLAMLPTDLPPHLQTLFIKEIVRMTNRNLDIALLDTKQQQMFTIKEGLLRMAFSAQYIFCKKAGSSAKPTWSSKFAWAFMNLRLVCSSIAQVLTRQEAHSQPMFIHSLRGLLRWAGDFLIWLADSLITLKRATKKMSIDSEGTSVAQAFMSAAIAADSPALSLLVFSFTRTFIKFLGTAVVQSFSIMTRVLPNARSVVQRQEMEDSLSYYSKLPFKPPVLLALLTEIDASVRKNYKASDIPPERRAEIEIEAMTSPTIPVEMVPVFRDLVEVALPKFMDGVDLAELYFRDTTWIGMEAVPKGGMGEGRREWDVVKKLPIGKGVRVRECRRCGSVMEDLGPERMREVPSWMVHASRHCVCGGYWVMRREERGGDGEGDGVV